MKRWLGELYLTIAQMILEIKILLLLAEKYLCQYHRPNVYMTAICIVYLHIIEACLKVMATIYIFFHLKDHSKIMKNDFHSILMYS